MYSVAYIYMPPFASLTALMTKVWKLNDFVRAATLECTKLATQANTKGYVII